VFIARHGRTRWNEERRLQGVSDIDTSEGGKQETEEAARFLGAQDIAEVWTSPLVRCRRLAEALAERLQGAVVRVVPDLIEQNFGVWEGLTAREIAERFPREWGSFQKDRCAYAPPGGEAYRDLERRALRVFQGAVVAIETVALVTHYNVVTSIWWHLNGLSPCGLLDFPYPPGAVLQVDRTNPGLRGYIVFRPNSGKWFRA
jgi:probable phosphoglycerate mutase